MTWLKLIHVQFLLGSVALLGVLSYFLLPVVFPSICGMFAGLLLSGFTLNYLLLRGDGFTLDDVRINEPGSNITEFFNGGHDLESGIIADLKSSTEVLMLADINKGARFPLSYQYKMQCQKCTYKFILKISHYGYDMTDRESCWVLLDGHEPDMRLHVVRVALTCAEQKSRIMDEVLI